MKKLTFLLSSAIVLGGIGFAGGTVHAAEADSATTKGEVTVEKGDTTTPVDPIEPIQPPTGHTGELTIDAASNLKFENLKTTGGSGSQVVKAVPQPLAADETVLEKLGVQVSDRRGSGSGWILKTSLSQKFMNGSEELKGAELALPAGALFTGNAAGPTVDAPVTAAVNPVNDSPQIIMDAGVDTGLGTWGSLFDAENVTLTVPNGNKTGTYTAELTWTLEDVPAP